MNSKHYNLYCLNPKCRASIYQDTQPIQVEFNSLNLLATHHCKHCNCKLVSLMDMKVSEIAASASVQISVDILPICLN
jgi:hypothetical protein